MKMQIRRRETFCASHRLYNPELSDAQNSDLYKKCATIHGHNYSLVIGISGTVRDDTGMIIPFEDMKEVIGAVVDRFDHTYLNDHEYFKHRPTTVENVAQHIWALLADGFNHRVELEYLELHETEKNSVVLTRS